MRRDRATVAGAGETRTHMTRQEILELFKRREHAYEDLDAAALATDYADDAVIESPAAGVHQGREAAEKARIEFEEKYRAEQEKQQQSGRQTATKEVM